LISSSSLSNPRRSNLVVEACMDIIEHGTILNAHAKKKESSMASLKKLSRHMGYQIPMG